MSDINNRINDAAENATLKLVARVCMICMLPIGGFIGANVLSKVDRLNDSSVRQEETLRNLTMVQIPNIRTTYDKALVDHDRRIGKLEDWRVGFPTTARP